MSENNNTIDRYSMDKVYRMLKNVNETPPHIKEQFLPGVMLWTEFSAITNADAWYLWLLEDCGIVEVGTEAVTILDQNGNFVETRFVDLVKVIDEKNPANNEFFHF